MSGNKKISKKIRLYQRIHDFPTLTKEEIFECLSTAPSLYRHLTNGQKNDRDIVLFVVRKQSYVIFHLPEAYRNDVEVFEESMKYHNDSSVIQYMGKNIHDNEELIYKYVRQLGQNFSYVSYRIRNNVTLMLKMVKRDPSIYKHASYTLTCMPTLSKAAVIRNGLLLKYVTKTLRYKFDIILTAIKNTELALCHCPSIETGWVYDILKYANTYEKTIKLRLLLFRLKEHLWDNQGDYKETKFTFYARQWSRPIWNNMISFIYCTNDSTFKLGNVDSSFMMIYELNTYKIQVRKYFPHSRIHESILSKYQRKPHIWIPS